MPRNANRFVKQHRIDIEELKIQAQMYYLGEAGIKPPKLKKNSRLEELARAVYTRFEEETVRQKRPASIPAAEMEHLLAGSSRTTVNKLKKTLGIRSVRIQSTWYWSFPRRPLSTAKAAAHKAIVTENNAYLQTITQLTKPAVLELKAIMEEHNYQMTNKFAIEMMTKSGYTRRTTVGAKAILGVASMKVSGAWMWLYPADAVQKWVKDKLVNGSVPHQQLALEAYQEHGWCWELIRLAQRMVGGITWSFKQGVGGVWTDINAHRPPPSEAVVDIPIFSDAEDDHNIVLVDFSTDEEEHDLAPAADKVDPEPTPRTLHVGKINLEIFE